MSRRPAAAALQANVWFGLVQRPRTPVACCFPHLNIPLLQPSSLQASPAHPTQPEPSEAAGGWWYRCLPPQCPGGVAEEVSRSPTRPHPAGVRLWPCVPSSASAPPVAASALTSTGDQPSLSLLRLWSLSRYEDEKGGHSVLSLGPHQRADRRRGWR